MSRGKRVGVLDTFPGLSLECGSRSDWVERLDEIQMDLWVMVGPRMVDPGRSLEIGCNSGRSSQAKPALNMDVELRLDQVR